MVLKVIEVYLYIILIVLITFYIMDVFLTINFLINSVPKRKEKSKFGVSNIFSHLSSDVSHDYLFIIYFFGESTVVYYYNPRSTEFVQQMNFGH